MSVSICAPTISAFLLAQTKAAQQERYAHADFQRHLSEYFNVYIKPAYREHARRQITTMLQQRQQGGLLPRPVEISRQLANGDEPHAAGGKPMATKSH